MPLADYVPRLDNRNFDDLVEEARARVPRYTSELTDFNPGDPAFALIELNAWMTDLLLYRLGRVSELHYLKFLELVGIELKPAIPASTIIVIPVQATFAGPSVIVPARTAVSSAEPDDKGPIVFETSRAFTAINARLTALQVNDGFSIFDRTPVNAPGGAGFTPFGDLATEGASLMFGLDSNVALPGEAELSIGIFAAAVATGGVTQCGNAMHYRPGKIAFEAWSGLSWLPMTTLSDDTNGFTRSGTIRVRLPKAGSMPRAAFGSVTTKLFYIRARLALADYDRAPRLTYVALNAVPALQAETLEYEILGGSDGSPDQVFRLANVPVLEGSLVVEVDEGDDAGFTAWTEVEDFYGVDAHAKAYVLDRANGEIRFGSEQALIGGRIPAANRLLARSNIRARIYRFGGGQRGNLPAGGVSVLMNVLAGLDAGAVTNPVASAGGADEETIDEIIERAPRSLRARDRAVTAEDFEQFAKDAGPVRRAKAFALAHPQFPGIEVPGVVTLVIVPDSDAPAPRPSEALRLAVCENLQKYRLIGTELYVTGPDYAKLALAITAVAEPSADPAVVKQAIEKAARAFLHPLTGGVRGTGWPFGGPVHYGELYQAIAVAGVQRLDDIALTLEGIEIEPCKSATIGPTSLIELVDITVEVTNANDTGDGP